jgi:hypothetical protein
MHVAHVKAVKFPMLPFDHGVHGNDPIYTLFNFFWLVLSKL